MSFRQCKFSHNWVPILSKICLDTTNFEEICQFFSIFSIQSLCLLFSQNSLYIWFNNLDEIAITNNIYLCSHSQKTKTLCRHGWRFLYIYCFRLSEASSFRRKKFSMRNKLNDVYAFPDQIKSVLCACSEGKLSWKHFHFASNKAHFSVRQLIKILWLA